SSSAVAPVPLAVVLPRGRMSGARVAVTVLCGSRTRACSGTVRALGHTRRFTLAPRASRPFRFALHRPLRAAPPQRRLRVRVDAGERRRVYRVRVAG
ncbi:MAG TPA: hypothetical protein VGV67_08160, partial [Solirubrobacteraceae bacterium]|nr:hypothetical protein [Solirubrobacteraceae bacterium]